MLGGEVSDDEAEVLEDRIRRMEGPLPSDEGLRTLARAGDRFDAHEKGRGKAACAHKEEEKFELDGARPRSGFAHDGSPAATHDASVMPMVMLLLLAAPCRLGRTFVLCCANFVHHGTVPLVARL